MDTPPCQSLRGANKSLNIYFNQLFNNTEKNTLRDIIFRIIFRKQEPYNLNLESRINIGILFFPDFLNIMNKIKLVLKQFKLQKMKAV